MVNVTIQVPDAKHERLRRLAERQGLSLNKLFEEWSNIAIAQADAEARFMARAARGNVKRGLAILDKLDRAFSKRKS